MAADKASPRDNMFWAAALLVLIAGVVAFFYFAGEVMTFVRVLGLLVSVVVAAIIAAQTPRGREMLGFVRETDVERRKVVWPTRQETTQTTLIVIVITIIVAIMLFIMDSIFGWIIRRLIGVGGGN